MGVPVTREEMKRRLVGSSDLIWRLLQSDVGKDYCDGSLPKEQSDAFEKMVGNEIFYQSTTIVFWTGMMSEELIRLGHLKHECRDHQWPRKLAMKHISDMGCETSGETVDVIAESILTKFGTWNLVTKEENAKLRPHQKVGVFTTPEEAYGQAGIKLLPVTQKERNLIYSGDQKTIDEVLSR